jgi:hypothetical protein
MTVAQRGQQALDAPFWRAEILQAMYWMRGERIDAEVEPTRLAEFLAVDTDHISADAPTGVGRIPGKNGGVPVRPHSDGRCRGRAKFRR